MSRLDGNILGDEIVFEVMAQSGESVAVALDTGSTGEFTLDPETAARLGFSEPLRMEEGELADGSIARLPVALGTVIWLGRRRQTRAVLVKVNRGTIGMGLLRDVIVHIDTHAGVASIDRAV
ncbi:MAG: hypothetical protein AAB434_04125 [Planctomycetota bacterium]